MERILTGEVDCTLDYRLGKRVYDIWGGNRLRNL